ncbi:acyltransferase [Novosphingobium sp.]|uniref:acyltransferase family protein n=1 Tax=Novosphingobium sp. TaxID=1874826 RepID=UPI0031DD4174
MTIPASHGRNSAMAESKKTASNQIYGLDLLRFVAALFVVMFHLTYGFWADGRQSGEMSERTFHVYAPLGEHFAIGWIGVQIFFVISGFVIAYTANGRSPMYFIRRRFLRLLPGIWACSLLSVPFLLALGMPVKEIAFRMVNSVLILPFVAHVANSYWTLPIEMCFYTAIFAIILTNNFKHLENFAALLIGWSGFFWIGHFTVPQHNMLLSALFGMNKLTQLVLLQYAAFFALGILIWLNFKFGLTARRAALVAVAVVIDVVAILGETQKSSQWFADQQSFGVAVSIWAVSLLFFVFSIYRNDLFDRMSPRLKIAIRWIGLSTYPLYLIHQPFSEPVLGALLKQGFNPWAVLAFGLGANIALALGIAIYLEPLLRDRFEVIADRLFTYLPVEKWGLNRYRDPLDI